MEDDVLVKMLLGGFLGPLFYGSVINYHRILRLLLRNWLLLILIINIIIIIRAVSKTVLSPGINHSNLIIPSLLCVLAGPQLLHQVLPTVLKILDKLEYVSPCDSMISRSGSSQQIPE
jgi:hypothetical protein